MGGAHASPNTYLHIQMTSGRGISYANAPSLKVGLCLNKWHSSQQCALSQRSIAMTHV